MNDDVAIKVEHVSKTFKLPHEKSSSVKSALINFVRHKRGYEVQHVLDDISFEVKRGEFFGIVGRNGSGKSTLLKLLAGIYTPTKGDIQINGKLTPFIELGVGFSPELTGRENVFLNGALLGFNRREMEAMYDDIVEFAELERFMDQKLKNYSSGMQVRLAFSIAIRAKGDILVLDEVLAVGDESFQRKSIDVFEQYKAAKRTVVLVTHDMASVTKFCDRAILFSDSKLIDEGAPSKIAREYSALNQESIDAQTQTTNDQKGKDSKISAAIFDENGKPNTSFWSGQKLHIVFKWERSLPLENIGFALIKQTGELVYGANTIRKTRVVPKDTLRFAVEVGLNLAPGRYYLVYGAFGRTALDSLDFVEKGPELIVKAKPDTTWSGVTMLDTKWIKME